MILYHYTAFHLASAIERSGVINPGYVPNCIKGKWELIPGYIWLSVSPIFNNQTWGIASQNVPYNRNAVQIAVEVPDGEVINWMSFCEHGSITPEAARILNSYGDPQNWRLFKGSIPREKIVGMKDNPSISRGDELARVALRIALMPHRVRA